MDVRRRGHKNKLINEIREIENIISRNESTIVRIKNTNMGVEYINNQINKLKKIIQEKTELLEQKKIELDGVSHGLSDTFINEEYKKNSLRQKNDKIEKKKQKNINDAEKKEKKEISQKYWKGIISESISEKQKERDYKHGLKYFRKVSDQLPEYMKKSLSEMPNNKGYIWRGINFYGDLPAKQNESYVMFEKQRGGILVIHEYSNNEYRRYEKHGKEKKQLVFKKFRNLKS